MAAKHHRFTFGCLRALRPGSLASLDSGWFGIDRWCRSVCINATTVRATAANSPPGCASNYRPRASKKRTARSGCKLSHAVRLRVQSGQFLVLSQPRRPVARAAGRSAQHIRRAPQLSAQRKRQRADRREYAAHVPQSAGRVAILPRGRRLHLPREESNSASVSIHYHDADGLLIRTALGGRLTPLTRASALAALLRQPLLTVGVIARIHWQALRLALKKVPFTASIPRRPAPATRPRPRRSRPTSAAARPISSIEEIQPWRFQEP